MHFLYVKKVIYLSTHPCPVLYNEQNVHLYRMDIEQYRDEPLQITQIFS